MHTNKLEEQLFVYFHEGREQRFLTDAIKEAGVAERRLEDLLTGHYYLSPINLIRSQKLFVLLTILLALTITAIRSNTNWVLVGLSFITGLALALPFLLNFLVMRKIEQLVVLGKFAWFSLAYAVLLTLLFVVVAFNSGIYGASIIPLLIIALYYMELRKLVYLQQQLAVYKQKS